MLMRILVDQISLHVIGLSALLVGFELGSCNLLDGLLVFKVASVFGVAGVVGVFCFFLDDFQDLREAFLVFFDGDDSEFMGALSFDHGGEVKDKSEDDDGDD